MADRTGKICAATAIVVVFLFVFARPAAAVSAGLDPLSVTRPDESFTLIRNYDSLVDTGAKLSIDDVTHNTSFRAPDYPTFRFGYSAYPIWFRFTISNALPHDAPLFLNTDASIVDRVELFEPTSTGGFAHTVLSSALPLNARPYRSEGLVFRLGLKPGETRTYYLRVLTRNSVYLPLSVGGEIGLLTHLGGELLLLFLVLGVMIGMFFYNLILAVSTRISMYGYYSLYIGAAVLYTVTGVGWWLSIFPDLAMGYLVNLLFVFGIGVTVSVLLFTRAFLNLPQSSPRGNQATLICIALSALLVALMPIVNFRVISETGGALISATALLVIYLGVARWRAGDKGARFFVIAWTPLMLSLPPLILQRLGIMRNELPINIVNGVLTALETVLLSLALAYRIRFLIDERVQAQTEALDNLEKIRTLQARFVGELEAQVKQRTDEIAQAHERVKSLAETIRQNAAVQQSLFESSVSIHRMERIEDMLRDAVANLTALFAAHRFGIMIHEARQGAVDFFNLDKFETAEQALFLAENALLYNRDKQDILARLKTISTESAVRYPPGYRWQFVDIPGRGDKLFGHIFIHGEPIHDDALQIILVFAAQISAAIENRVLSLELERLANSDALTGLANRAVVDRVLPRLIANASGHPKIDFAVIMGDLDGLKGINDRYGHEAGDQLLMLAANVMMMLCRTRDVVARLGGDEFVVLCPSTDYAGATHLALRMQQEMSETLLQLKQPDGTLSARPVLISLGVASSSGSAPDAVFEAADAAMYAEKESHYQKAKALPHAADNRTAKDRE